MERFNICKIFEELQREDLEKEAAQRAAEAKKLPYNGKEIKPREDILPEEIEEELPDEGALSENEEE